MAMSASWIRLWAARGVLAAIPRKSEVAEAVLARADVGHGGADARQGRVGLLDGVLAPACRDVDAGDSGTSYLHYRLRATVSSLLAPAWTTKSPVPSRSRR